MFHFPLNAQDFNFGCLRNQFEISLLNSIDCNIVVVVVARFYAVFTRTIAHYLQIDLFSSRLAHLQQLFFLIQVFFPASSSSTIEQIRSQVRENWATVANTRKPYYWVPTREEAEAITVPSEPTVDSKLTNEIEFQKSDELLVPGKIFTHVMVLY